MEVENEKNYNDIDSAIVKTIAFFDIFNRALTPFEIWQCLSVKCSFSAVFLSLVKNENIFQKDGYYFLKDRAGIVSNVTSQYNLANQKFKIAKKAASKICFLSGVEMVGVCNNFLYKKESDIDFFIIVSPRRMWLTRALVTIILHFFKLRRHGKKITNRICLSFYTTKDNLNLENLALKDIDPYFYHWFLDLTPIYGQETYEEFFKENNWLKNIFPNSFHKKMCDQKTVKDNFLTLFGRINGRIILAGFIGDFLEKFAKKIQLKKMSYNLNSLSAKNDSRVIIDDKILKFHESDRREEFKNIFLEKMKHLSSKFIF